MNDKIEQLKKEALVFAVEKIPAGITNNPIDKKFWKRMDVASNKFAELIVRECIGILEPKSRYMGEGPEVLKDKISQIKKHFGVEL